MKLVCMQLVFATNNQHKLGEISALLGNKFQLMGLKDLNISEEIPEDHETLEENASQKAWYIFNKTGKNCFADDTGLEVDYLNGAPGVYSARYSRMGSPTFPEMEAAKGNIKKLLLKLEGAGVRTARFRTVISLVQAIGIRFTHPLEDLEQDLEVIVLLIGHYIDHFIHSEIIIPKMSRTNILRHVH